MSRDDYLREAELMGGSVDFSKIAVDHGIPIPPHERTAGRGRKNHEALFPFKEMRVGDSFFVPAWRLLPSLVAGASSEYTKRHPHVKFLTRTYHNPNGVRVWRVGRNTPRY